MMCIFLVLYYYECFLIVTSDVTTSERTTAAVNNTEDLYCTVLSNIFCMRCLGGILSTLAVISVRDKNYINTQTHCRCETSINIGLRTILMRTDLKEFEV